MVRQKDTFFQLPVSPEITRQSGVCDITPTQDGGQAVRQDGRRGDAGHGGQEGEGAELGDVVQGTTWKGFWDKLTRLMPYMWPSHHSGLQLR